MVPKTKSPLCSLPTTILWRGTHLSILFVCFPPHKSAGTHRSRQCEPGEIIPPAGLTKIGLKKTCAIWQRITAPSSRPPTLTPPCLPPNRLQSSYDAAVGASGGGGAGSGGRQQPDDAPYEVIVDGPHQDRDLGAAAQAAPRRQSIRKQRPDGAAVADGEQGYDLAKAPDGPYYSQVVEGGEAGHYYNNIDAEGQMEEEEPMLPNAQDMAVFQAYSQQVWFREWGRLGGEDKEADGSPFPGPAVV